MALDTEVLIIGAGPIGLIHAWGIKQLNPKLKIVVLEKHAEYQRKHTLLMQNAQLKDIIKATHSESNPALMRLLAQLEQDPHIRTSELQNIFSKLACDSGVEIRTTALTEANSATIIADEYPNARLIIGADGTHSVTSKTLYPTNNQITQELDYVLQLRYEINGSNKAPNIKNNFFITQMASMGLVASEYVGNFDANKTPITMQMMISSEDFAILEKYTSRDPLKLWAKDSTQTSPLPPLLGAFITKYIARRIETLNETSHNIDSESISISVNKAPITYAKTTVHRHNKASTVLVGDAALGLSYFKGLNAGLEACAKFLTLTTAAIQNSWANSEQNTDALNQYQAWFSQDFAPKKITEVSRYSFWRIRSLMQLMRTTKSIVNASMRRHDDDLTESLVDYFRHYNNESIKWNRFPHRDHDIVKLAQLEYVPLKHNLKKIIKIFVDYLKPYKSQTQFIQDYKQPLVGIANFSTGIAKLIIGVLSLNGRHIVDGLLHILRGTIELITTPLAWILKPIVRGTATLIHGGFKKIEENTGIKQLAQSGLNYLDSPIDDAALESSAITILAICHDIHRKVCKSIERGQTSACTLEEQRHYTEIIADKKADRTKLTTYFELFAKPRTDLKLAQENPHELII